MLQHWNRQFLVGTNDILKKSPTLKSSLCKVCEFKYAFLKRERDRERERQRQILVRGLLQKELKKKNKKKPTHIPLLIWLLRVYFYVLVRTHCLHLRSSAGFSPFFFFFFGHFPVQVSQRPERQKDLTFRAASNILFHYAVIIPDDNLGLGRCRKCRLGRIVRVSLTY